MLIDPILDPFRRFLRLNTYGRKRVAVTYILSDVSRDKFIEALRRLGIRVYPLFYQGVYVVLTEAQHSFLTATSDTVYILPKPDIPFRGNAILRLANYIPQQYGDPANGGKEITSGKLQKLLYFLYGSYYAVYDRPLFDAQIRASYYGPFIPVIYWHFVTNGCLPLSPSGSCDVSCLNGNEKDLIDFLTDLYNVCTFRQLSQISRDQDPWRIASDNGKKCPHNALPSETPIIHPETIYEYFKGEAYNDYP